MKNRSMKAKYDGASRATKRRMALCSVLRDELWKPKRDSPKIFYNSEKIFRIAIFETNSFLRGCQIEKTIWFVALPIIYQIS